VYCRGICSCCWVFPAIIILLAIILAKKVGGGVKCAAGGLAGGGRSNTQYVLGCSMAGDGEASS